MYRRGFYDGFGFHLPPFSFELGYLSKEDRLHHLERYKRDLEYELKK